MAGRGYNWSSSGRPGPYDDGDEPDFLEDRERRRKILPANYDEPHENRVSLIIIGDSIVRDLDLPRDDFRVFSYPGATLNRDTIVEFEIKIRYYKRLERGTTVVVHIGSNNLLYYGSAASSPQPLINEMRRALANWIQIPRIRIIINGILPRAYALHRDLIDAANRDLQELIAEPNYRGRVNFHAIQNRFIHNHGLIRGSTQELRLFKRNFSNPSQDGIHLNSKGLTVFAYAINDAVR